MKLGRRLLLTLLAFLTFALASHQAIASTDSVEPCLQDISVVADEAHAPIGIDHCVTCCQAGQALPFAVGALDFETAMLQVAVRLARHADIELALHGKLLRPPRFA